MQGLKHMDKKKLFFASIVGASAGLAIIALGENLVLPKFYSLPTGVDPKDKNALAAAIATMPIGAFLALLVNYGLASLLGGLVASLVVGRDNKKPALIVGVLLTMAGLANCIMVPQPIWFTALNLLEYLPFAYLGFLIVQKKQVL